MTPFYAERMVHPSIEEAVRDILVDGSVPDVPDAKAWAEQMVELCAFLEKRWREATSMQRKCADRRTKPCEFAVGNMVWLSGKNIRTKQPSKKFDHRFYGPYPVVERVGTQAYRLKLLQEVGNIHHIFHMSLLEPYVSDGRTAPKPPPPIELDSQEEYELEAILQSGYRRGVFRYLVKYKGYGPEESEWLPAKNLANAQDMVRDFHLSHPNQPKLPESSTCSRPGRRQGAT